CRTRGRKKPAGPRSRDRIGRRSAGGVTGVSREKSVPATFGSMTRAPDRRRCQRATAGEVGDRPRILGVRRRSARLLLMIAAMLATRQCVLPPDPPTLVETHYPPEVDLGTLVPAKPLLDISIRLDGDTDQNPLPCKLLMGAGRVFDRDSPTLLVRYVADN